MWNYNLLSVTRLHEQILFLALGLGVNWLGCEANHSLPSSYCLEIYLHSSIRMYDVVLS